MMPLNLNEVWKVMSAGPRMPQNRCTSSQVFMLPIHVARPSFFRSM